MEKDSTPESVVREVGSKTRRKFLQRKRSELFSRVSGERRASRSRAVVKA